MAKLTDTANRIVESLRSGNLDEAEADIGLLQQLIAGYVASEEQGAAAGLVLEARTLARVHRAQTAQSLRSLRREGLYEVGFEPRAITFDVDG